MTEKQFWACIGAGILIFGAMAGAYIAGSASQIGADPPTVIVQAAVSKERVIERVVEVEVPVEIPCPGLPGSCGCGR